MDPHISTGWRKAYSAALRLAEPDRGPSRRDPMMARRLASEEPGVGKLREAWTQEASSVETRVHARELLDVLVVPYPSSTLRLIDGSALRRTVERWRCRAGRR